ncbi:Mss4-like protein [Trichophaea hybrida]|nr:Mss4-like protein [Trichophaea hybrida]
MDEHNKRQVHKNRMNRPPYSLPVDPEHQPFQALYTGSCFCEKVMFEISREKPLDAKFCHCPTCQRLHGVPFQWLIYWNPEEKSQDYIIPCKISCKHCCTPIMDEGRNMLLLYPTLVYFKDLKHKWLFYPTCHIFYSRRAIDIPDSLPKWEEYKDQSKLMPETLREECKEM